MIAQELPVGTALRLGSYRIEKILGRGGFGITYLAVHTMLDKKVAIKEFFPKDFCDRDTTSSHVTVYTSNSTEIVERLRAKFIKEAKNIAKLRHRNIISIQDIFEENGTAYYVMDFVEGMSLKDIIDVRGTINEDEALDYIGQIGAALSYMHGMGMNHLDIKPSNIMISSGDNQAILIDFGTAKQYDSAGDQTSTMVPGFTHGYAPIEQYKPGGVAQFSPQTDVYALGATLFTMLKGEKPPHYSEIFEEGIPELPATVSKHIKKAIEHAMELKKAKRPESVDVWIQELVKIPSSPQRPSKPVLPLPPQHSDEADDNTVLVAPPVPTPPKEDKKTAPQAHITTGYENGHEWVDLGLPSGTLWATKNVEDENSSDLSRYYFAWGEDHAKNDYRKGTYNINFYMTPMSASPDLWGSKWVVPSKQDFMELINECRWNFAIHMYNGERIVGADIIGPNGNFIFLPFMGYVKYNIGIEYGKIGLYWSNTSDIEAFPCYFEISLKQKNQNNGLYSQTYISKQLCNTINAYNGLCYRLVLKPD